jgi:hypothetical protein
MGQGPSTRFVDVAKDIKPYEGQLTIRSIDRRGNVFVYDTPNVITFTARIQMAHLLVGDSSSSYSIGFIAVGLNNTAPQRSDTALYQQVLQQTIEPYDFPNGDTGEVEITATLDFTSAANGSTLQEAGLFGLNGSSMFARQVHGAIAKDATIQLQYIWRIIFT